MSQIVGWIVSQKSSNPLNAFFFNICAINPYQKNQSELRADTRSGS